MGGRNTSNISPESCPISSSVLLATELKIGEGLPREPEERVRAATDCGGKGKRKGGALPRAMDDEVVIRPPVVCLIAPRPPVGTNAYAAPYPERQTFTSREHIGTWVSAHEGGNK